VDSKVYIVEDHEDMRMILKRAIRRNFPHARIAGESDTAEKAMTEIPVVCPSVVLVDISLPGIDGIELIRRLHPGCPTIWFLVVTGHNVDQYQKEAFAAGADDIVSKEDFEKLISIIGKMLDNEKPLG
jgi:DNA-binding NarL/FixJ family response regulator